MSSRQQPLRIMKFGGTSVGDASRIAKVAEIVREAADQSHLVVVVSALAGVTNRLVEAADRAEAGQRERVDSIFHEIRSAHEAVANTLLGAALPHSNLQREINLLIQEGKRRCGGTAQGLTLSSRDSILSLGERLSAPLVSAALAECGIKSQSIEATELVITDQCHGAAEPVMDLTRRCCEARLRPLLREGIVPVITGFIGATADGALTTLGRGGSDYSATILGAALDADEVIIWTDVDGLMTADPRLVSGASTIAEISYREAAEFARCGAKVLHPKTLSPVEKLGIPILIRNTFAPALPGTRITPAGPAENSGVKGLAVTSDVHGEQVSLGPDGALISVVGTNLRSSHAERRMLSALVPDAVKVRLLGSSDYSISFVVAREDVKTAAEAAHREFELGPPGAPTASAKICIDPVWRRPLVQGTASAD